MEKQPNQENVIIRGDYVVSHRKEEIIIFGRSPFINKLKLNKIDYSRFDICCCNYPLHDIIVHYVVSADTWVKPKLAPRTEWISGRGGWDFIKNNNVLKDGNIIQEARRLTWFNYTSDLAVNFAIMRGYKKIYLGGIDLIEDNQPFRHYDGVVNEKVGGKLKEEKEYIKYLGEKFNVEIYQLNPKANWLEFRDIGIL